ncbi:hypothetical protein JOM56_000101 [Amanita muscaria]
MGPECQALQDTLMQSSAPTTPNRSTPPASGCSSSRGSAVASSTLSCPASSLLLSTKPFKCPKPNCNKSYKQANGLKYHMTHGSCNFAPPNDLLEWKRRNREKLNGAADRREHLEGVKALAASVEVTMSEWEAERWMKPFACGVGASVIAKDDTPRTAIPSIPWSYQA